MNNKVTSARLLELSTRYNFKIITHQGRPFQMQGHKYLAFNCANATEPHSYALEFTTEEEALAFVKENDDFRAFVEKTTVEYFQITD